MIAPQSSALLQDQRRKLAEYLQSRTRVPYYIGYLISHIRQLREQHSKSEKAIEVLLLAKAVLISSCCNEWIKPVCFNHKLAEDVSQYLDV